MGRNGGESLDQGAGHPGISPVTQVLCDLGKSHYLLSHRFFLCSMKILSWIGSGDLFGPYFLHHNILWSKAVKQVPCLYWQTNEKCHGRSLDSWGKVKGKGCGERVHKSTKRQTKGFPIQALPLSHPMLPISTLDVSKSWERPGHVAVTIWWWNLNGLSQLKFSSCL